MWTFTVNWKKNQRCRFKWILDNYFRRNPLSWNVFFVIRLGFFAIISVCMFFFALLLLIIQNHPLGLFWFFVYIFAVIVYSRVFFFTHSQKMSYGYSKNPPICTCPCLCIILTEFICDKFNIILSNLLTIPWNAWNSQNQSLSNTDNFFWNKQILDAVGTLLWFCVAQRIASHQVKLYIPIRRSYQLFEVTILIIFHWIRNWFCF